MLRSFLLFVIYVFLFPTTSTIFKTDKKPIIGIFTTPSDFPEVYDSNQFSYIKTSYIQLIELGGGYPIVIPWDINEQDLSFLLNSVNGLLLVGGDTPNVIEDPETGKLILSDYTLRVKQIIEYAINLFDKGQYFPIFGICQGPEIAVTAMSQDTDLLKEFDHNGVFDQLEFTEEGRKSRLFSYYPSSMFEFLEKNKTSFFEHSLGIKPSSIDKSPKLNDLFHVIAMGKDNKNKKFVAAMEEKKYPFYFTQYHPENALQSHNNKEGDISKDEFDSSYYIAKLFIDEAKKNDHVIPDDSKILKKFHVDSGKHVYLDPQFHDLYFYKKLGADIYPKENRIQRYRLLDQLNLG